ncbi:MAG TPA: right-handed parallel beta-helix repeat-containing protein [Nitrolancea sp.]|nr:right-handed parallel beta-helix repeat-containing protein [Nitrolancea sp.]
MNADLRRLRLASRPVQWVSRLGMAMLFGGGLTLGAALLTGAPAGAVPLCVAAGSTGLTTSVVANSGDVVSGIIDATGCDIGIYAGPGSSNVTVDGATVSNANDHGILFQDVSNSIIKNSTVSNNGLAPTNGIEENKGLQLVGTYNVTVQGNIVTGNLADGGIAINDDGPINPGAPNAGYLRAATHNLIQGNQIYGNSGGCGVVLSAYNSGAGVSNNQVVGNNVYNNLSVPIVVAANLPNTTASQNSVMNNTITNNDGPGVVVHSNAPGDVVTRTTIYGNTISGNGSLGPETNFENTGIAIRGEVNPVTYTTVMMNTITDEYYGIFSHNSQRSLNLEGTMNHATIPFHAE